MAKIGLPKGSGKWLKVREKSVKSQGIFKWILSGNPEILKIADSQPDNSFIIPKVCQFPISPACSIYTTLRCLYAIFIAAASVYILADTY